MKTFKVAIWLLLINFLLAIPQFEWNKSIGWVRLLFIPFLLLLLLDLVIRVGKTRIKLAIGMGWPILGLLFLFVLQALVIPSGALNLHLSGCIKFVSWILLYFCALLAITKLNAQKMAKSIVVVLSLVFLGIVLQYPFLIFSAAGSLGEVIASYGNTSAEKDIHGLFAAANEDANGMVTLLPFFLFHIEKLSGLRRLVFRGAIFLYIPFILLFNGTRTALFISFPIVLFLFYIRFSLRSLIRFIPLVLGIVAMTILYASQFIGQAFQGETLNNGNFGWRVLRLWIPASHYTFEHSPIFGFGSRGWDYVGMVNSIVRSEIGSVASIFDTTPPHNVYIWVYVSWGVMGLFVYLSFLALLLKESFRCSISRVNEVTELGKAAFCATVGYCIWAAISNAHLEGGWLILFAIGLIVASLRWMLFRSEVTLPSVGQGMELSGNK
jgi:O-antigen ligase